MYNTNPTQPTIQRREEKGNWKINHSIEVSLQSIYPVIDSVIGKCAKSEKKNKQQRSKKDKKFAITNWRKK